MRRVGRLAVTLSRRSSLIVTQSHPSHIPVSTHAATKSAQILFGIFTEKNSSEIFSKGTYQLSLSFCIFILAKNEDINM